MMKWAGGGDLNRMSYIVLRITNFRFQISDFVFCGFGDGPASPFCFAKASQNSGYAGLPFFC